MYVRAEIIMTDGKVFNQDFILDAGDKTDQEHINIADSDDGWEYLENITGIDMDEVENIVCRKLLPNEEFNNTLKEWNA
jgi:hypothetical protein